MKITLCDIHIIYGLLYRYHSSGFIEHTLLYAISQKHTLYVSEFFVPQIIAMFLEKNDVTVSRKQVLSIIEALHLSLIDSTQIAFELISYVTDTNDLQVLQDAISVGSEYLITKNLTDFDIASIYADYTMHVVSTIPQDILDTLI